MIVSPSGSLRQTLLKVGSEYAQAKTTAFSQNALAQFIRKELKHQITTALGSYADNMIVSASAGAGTWADVPWVAVFDPLVTESAAEGYYIVYLFAPTRSEIYLSLNQGTTAVMEEFKADGLQVLRERATFMRKRIRDLTADFSEEEIQLGSAGRLPKAYEAGHALGKKYTLDALPSEDVLKSDLHKLLKTYTTLTYRGGLETLSEEKEESDRHALDFSLVERRQYRMHKRIERHSAAGKKVKKYHGTQCQGCGFEFKEKYGEIGDGFIEAHHLRPLSSLQEGVQVSYNIATDFAVLCSNCHRMIHKMPDPSDLKALQALIRR